MKNISLVKIITALCICNVYLFTCGVMGSVGESSATVDEAPVENEATGQGTQDFLLPDNNLADPVTPDNNTEPAEKIELFNFGAPPLNPVTADFVPSRLTEELPNKGSVSSSVSDGGNDNDTLIIDLPPVITPPDPPQSSSAPEEPSTPATSEPSDTSDVSGAETSDTPDTSDVPNTGETSDISDTSRPASSETSEPSASEPTTSEPADVPVQPDQIVTNTAAANEILSVSVNGDVVSGKALDIISGIVANEVGGSFAPEAIKAQAVAAYSYVKYFNLRGSSPSAALNEASDSIKVLVASVIGEAVYYNGEIIQATYSASSAGCTASSQNVWNTSLPYLQSVYCELDAQYDPNYGKTKKFKADDIKARVYATTGISLSGDPSAWFAVESRTEGKYVGTMSVGGYHTYIGSGGDTVTITGRVFRERIMSFDVRSSAFDIDYDPNTNEFTVTTYGYGHGVGMSQNGANALATYRGYDYKQILEFYYTGTMVR